MKELNEIDYHFPIKDSNGNPTFRTNQRETIERALDAFRNQNKRICLIDGPVGSGKSVINYTIGKCLGTSIYLTPFKQLQDQIVAEGWKGVRMIKGRSSYLCNKCSDGSTEVPCNYSGYDFEMCQNSQIGYTKSASDIAVIKESIRSNLDEYSRSETERRKHTSFEPDDNLDAEFKKIEEYVSKKDEESENGKTQYPIQSTVSCLMGPVECSMRSAKILAKIHDVRILNPDVFFNLTRLSHDYFGRTNLVVFDESHKIEEVMQRIFGVKIPVDTIYRFAGIDLSELLQHKNHDEFIEAFNEKYKKELGPFIACAKSLSDLRDLPKAENYKTFTERVKSDTEYKSILKLSIKSIKERGENFSILKVMNSAFRNDDSQKDLFNLFSPFMKFARNEFEKKCNELECDTNFDLIQRLRGASCSHYNSSSSEMETVKQIIDIGNAIDSLVNSVFIITRIKCGDKKPFAFEAKEINDARQVCGNIDGFNIITDSIYRISNIHEQYIDIVPVEIGALLEMFFLSYADKAILSTGTWTHLDSMCRTYGIKKDEMAYIKIPPTFNPDRRRIYVLENRNHTNFSEKDSSGDYTYRSEKGNRKVGREVTNLISNIRKFIHRNTHIDPNIIIHTGTYLITKIIAQYGETDERYLIHIGQNTSPITSEVSGHTTRYIHKNILLDALRDNPDSGLVLLSPSVKEGMDFKYGIARAQVILKRPMPYMGDLYTIEKTNEDRSYPNRECLTTILQQYGRVVRAEDDWGITFIFDQSAVWDVRRILSNDRNYNGFNLEYFKEGIMYKRDRYGRIVFNDPFRGL